LHALFAHFLVVLVAQAICSKAAAIPDKEEGPSPADKQLLSLLAELLFLENSRPVHRQLLSSLQRLPPHRFGTFQDLVLDKVITDIRTLLKSTKWGAYRGYNFAPLLQILPHA
jgi:hypothetical protein